MTGKVVRPPKLAQIRKIALAMPSVEERWDKYGPSFAVNGKTFAQCWLPKARWILRLPHHQEMMLFDTRPEIFAPMRAGLLLWSYVSVEDLDAAELTDLLRAAWRYRAPKKMVAAWEAEQRKTV